MPDLPLSPTRFALLAAVALGGCTTQEDIDRMDTTYGKSLYMTQCAQCHGDDGRGAGPASLGLGAPPPSLTQLSKRNGGVFPQDYVMATIDGLSRKDHPAAAMPEFGADDLGPLIQVEREGISTPIPADLLALANYLETIQE